MISDLTFVSDESLDVIAQVDLIKEEHKPLIMKYIIIQIAKKHPMNKMEICLSSGLTEDPNEFDDWSEGEVKVVFDGIESNYDFDKDKCKKFVYLMKGTKLVSECIINGDKKYSSEIGIDIVETLVGNAKKVNERFNKVEQEAVDDNNFWKTPNNQGSQLTFNQMQKYILLIFT